MALKTGTKLGPYEITARIGAGGMGEVYRATDTKLRRDVAIKVLPEDVARDRGRLARFEREAHVLASLNHANIASIYGLEESDGVPCLVLEMVEGQTLAERLARGALPMDEARELALQIALALEAAHEKGIVHRDLKPANVKVTPEGVVKVLDFGLAKALADESAETAGDASLSPTQTAATTRAGMVLGTAAYMSPEQARGKPVDKRADIWAFGAVLFEMLTGRQAFGRETVSDTMAAILKEEPVWDALDEATPPALLRVLSRCLTKDPRERLHDIADARIELAGTHADPVAPKAGRGPAWRTPVAVAVVAVVALVGGFWLGEAWRRPPESDSATRGAVARLEIELPPEASLGFGTTALGFDSPLVAISPDGTLIVYVGRSSSGTRLYRRRIDSFDDPVPIDGTEGALFAFFSPSGDWLGFLTNEAVKKVSLRAGDRPQIVSKARNPMHAEWAENGTIFFAEDEGFTLSSVPEAGGPVTEIDRLGRGGIQTYLSDVLPDGKHALIKTSTESISSDYANIYLLSLDTLDRTLLIERGYGARYVPTGHLVFARSGTLYAVPFDPSSLEVSGEPLPVMPGVSMESLFGQVQVAFSDSGTLIYVPGGDRAVGRLAVVDRYTNEVEFLDLPERVYGYFEFSPDGRRIAAQVADIDDYILIWDRTAMTGRKLVAPGSAGWPIWSPDGREIAYAGSIAGQGRGIFVTSALREDEPRQILASEDRVICVSWHPIGTSSGSRASTVGSASAFSRLAPARSIGFPGQMPARGMAPFFTADNRSSTIRIGRVATRSASARTRTWTSSTARSRVTAAWRRMSAGTATRSSTATATAGSRTR